MLKISSVLLIDDNPTDQLLTKRAFRKSGLCENIHIVNDGVEALEFLENTGKQIMGKDFPPSLILLDLNMQRMNGV